MLEITVNQDDIYKGNLVLINKNYPIQTFDKSITLIPANLQYPDILFDMKAASVLSHLMKKLDCTEDIVLVSGYRTFHEQQEIYTNSLVENGQKFTDNYIAIPNHSEHQTGLAIDLAKKTDTINFLRPEFPYEGICNEFRKKATEYGFIERYQSGKEAITGIAPEPWHFRYVGYPHSKIMAELDLSLEEYVDYVKAYPQEGRHLHSSHKDQIIEIFYVNISEALSSRIVLPDQALFQISGNNIDGVIVTIWR